MYGNYQGDGRPDVQTQGRPISSGSERIPISEIITCAKVNGAVVWDELGLDSIQPPPEIEYGNTKAYLADKTPHYGQIDGNGKIILSKKCIGKFTKEQFAQVLLMEMGNVKNLAALNAIQENIRAYYTAEQYSEAIEIIEYSSLEIVARYVTSDNSKLGQCIWTDLPKSFYDYLGRDGTIDHKQKYEDDWHRATRK